jgi:two-component system, sensor histidine kinase and response regulator
MTSPNNPADSSANADPPANREGPRMEGPWLFLIALLLSTFVATFQSYRQASYDAAQRFQDIAETAQSQLSTQFRHIDDALATAGAVIAASPRIDNLRWNDYLDSVANRSDPVVGLVRIEYRASQALGQSMVPPPSMVRVLTSSDVVPNSVKDQAGATPVILDAMMRARKSQRSASARLPTDAAPSASSTRRAADLMLFVRPVFPAFVPSNEPVGFLLAYVRIPDCMAFLTHSTSQRAAFSLHERSEPLVAGPVARDGSTYVQSLPIEIGTRPWALRVESTPALESELRTNTPWLILLLGLIGTSLLAGLVWLLTRLREQASAMATRMTNELRDQVKFTDDLIELNPNPIYRVDAQGRYVKVNRTWELLFQRRREDVIGKLSAEFDKPEAAIANASFDQAVLASADGYIVKEGTAFAADGHKIPAIIAKQVIRRADGTYDGIIGTVTDVTEIKKLQREIARQREQLDLVIRSSQQGILDLAMDADGGQYFSERFREILGFTAETFPKDFDWHRWIYPDDIAFFEDQLTRHLRQETPFFDVECRAIRATGGHMWIRVRGVAQYDEHQHARRFVGSIVDVTERREAELKLIEANIRVTEAARAKESFLATMSHEIRTPMNGVLGMAGLLAETKLNDEQRDYIRLIRASGDTLLRLIDDVLDFSKIESGRMTLEATTVEVVSMVEEAFELVAERAREKKLALVYELTDDVPYYVSGDVTRLRQILLNLMSNAIKFTDHGEVFLRMTSENLPDGRIKLQTIVRDTGIGIPADRVDKLFEAFTQVDASTTRKYGGTGLGLAIVKRLVGMMGGEVSLSSVEGQGSTFGFSIVTQVARGPVKPYMQRDVAEMLGKQLLFVDGNDNRRAIVAHRFGCWGWKVNAVAHTQAAAALSDLGEKLDVMLTDTLLPSAETDAVRTALAKVDAQRRAKGLSPIFVVLMSSLQRAELVKRTDVALMRHDLFVPRPASRVRMFDVLSQAANGRAGSDAATRPFSREIEAASDHPRPSVSALAPHSGSGRESAARPQLPTGFASLSILVAEDNEVNQRVIEGVLRRMGHRITLVTNGDEAVRAVAKTANAPESAFDIVLMDIHMPLLDGVAATLAIKQLFIHDDPAQRVTSLPIVAMTAHALAGDREHYLQSGMDDYISKPIRNDDLHALLVRCVPAKMTPSANTPPRRTGAHSAVATSRVPAVAKAGPAAITGAAAPAIAVLDFEQLNDMRDLPGDDTGKSLIDLFREKSDERLRLMASCLVDANWLLLGDIAHSLRGASASVGLPRVAAACKSLELAARQLAPKPGVTPTQNADTPPSQAQMDELYEDIKRCYLEADAALTRWLKESA